MFHDIHLTAQRNFSKFEGVGMQKPRENVLLAILIANNTFWSLITRFLALSFAWGGLKVVKIKKKFNFGFCYPKAFQGCNKKNPWCNPLRGGQNLVFNISQILLLRVNYKLFRNKFKKFIAWSVQYTLLVYS